MSLCFFNSVEIYNSPESNIWKHTAAFACYASQNFCKR